MTEPGFNNEIREIGLHKIKKEVYTCTATNTHLQECGAEFIFTAKRTSSSMPKKDSPTNRSVANPAVTARKANSGRGQREMFETVCAECGKTCQVPFQPRNDRPVYCSECF
jgi:CxxC-x17-CxxC domain-containing protein